MKSSEQLQRGDLELMGFEFIREIRSPTTGQRGVYAHLDGDEEGRAILDAIDNGELTIAQAKVDYATRIRNRR